MNKELGNFRRGDMTPEDLKPVIRKLGEGRNEMISVEKCKKSAEFWLDHLRNGHEELDALLGGVDQTESLIFSVRLALEEGGLTLEDIGTSEAELAPFGKVE